MKIATVSSKGQITIPKDILENILNITYGSKVTLNSDKGVLMVKPLKHSLVNQTAGSLKKFVNPKLLGIPFAKIREETQKLAATELEKKYE
ncbi:MAG TPA: AbrB/MazE/SpoVT family DNA-binding domain-containing protein [Candidatus Saccharimonadales bacterium]|nr:AbrB/MazE/SpoVT family DNA-binding domain-containing protein [Candidatus Saccharimonadales bacterium]